MKKLIKKVIKREDAIEKIYRINEELILFFKDKINFTKCYSDLEKLEEFTNEGLACLLNKIDEKHSHRVVEVKNETHG